MKNLLDVTRWAIKRRSTLTIGEVGLYLAHRDPDEGDFYVLFVKGQSEEELVGELDNRERAGERCIFTLVWEGMPSEDLMKLSYRIIDGYEADPWTLRHLDRFRACWRNVLARHGMEVQTVQ